MSLTGGGGMSTSTSVASAATQRAEQVQNTGIANFGDVNTGGVSNTTIIIAVGVVGAVFLASKYFK